MKILLAIVLFSQVLCAKNLTVNCDQKTYDEIYAQILRESIQDKSKYDMHNRNVLIRYLRKLCNGQKSTLEMKNTYPKKGKYNVQDN